MGRARVRLAVALLLLLALPASAAAKLTNLRSAQAVFTLDSDGVLEVLEHMSVQADGATAATWQVTMQRGELFAQPSVVVGEQRYRPGDGKQAGTFHISRGTHGIRFDWLQPDGTRPVRLGYRLALFGTAYTDVVDLRVPVWEGDWPVPVSELTAALKLPRPTRGQIVAWVEPQSVEATIARSPQVIRMRARDVGASTPVTLRTVLPRNVLTSVSGVNVQSKRGLASILAERRDSGRNWWPWAIVAAAALAISVVAFRTGQLRRPPRR